MRLIVVCGLLLVASGCASGAAVAGSPAAASSPPATTTTTTTTTTTVAVPPPVTTTTEPVPPQCQYVSLEAMRQATNVGWSYQKNNPADECWYLASGGFGVVESIELVIDPPGKIGRPAGATSVAGLGAPAYFDPSLRALVVHLPRHDFAVFLVQAPTLAGDPNTALTIARAIFAAAKPRLG